MMESELLQWDHLTLSSWCVQPDATITDDDINDINSLHSLHARLRDTPRHSETDSETLHAAPRQTPRHSETLHDTLRDTPRQLHAHSTTHSMRHSMHQTRILLPSSTSSNTSSNQVDTSPTPGSNSCHVPSRAVGTFIHFTDHVTD